MRFWVNGRQEWPGFGRAGFGGLYEERTAADAARRAIKEHPSGLVEIRVYRETELFPTSLVNLDARPCLSMTGNPITDGPGGEGADGSVLDEHGAVIGPDDWRWEHNHPWFTRKPWWRMWR